MSSDLDELRRENEVLRQRLDEAESIVRAITRHEVDAFVVQREGDAQVLVLDGVDAPYRLLIERMQQGAAILGWDGALIYVNGRLAEMFGVAVQSMVRTEFMDFVSPDDQSSFTDLLEQGRYEDAEREVALRGRDATSFPALLTVSPMLVPNRILCLIVTDLTQQKRLEAERAARTAAEQVAEVLRAADRRKDEFLAMLGHELRNPLAPLQHGLQVLDRIGSREPDAQHARSIMRRQLETLIRLVDDLLDVSRVTQGKIKLQLVRTDLKTVVGRALEGTRTLLDEHGHRIEVQLPDGAVPVDVDVVRMTQVITNLLNNAVKFTPGGGRIELSVITEPQARRVIVRVRDNGKGIAPDMLPRIFDLFTQADPGVSRSEGGLGIGLTLSRQLVETHNGTLEATSAGLGQGSEFIIQLPLAIEAQVPSATPAPGMTPGNQPRSGRRILVVDDNRDAAGSLMMLLRLLGHDVREANDGKQALAIMEEFVPEILLLDIGLPGMNGYEVARVIREQPRFKQVQIVALSGYSADMDIQNRASTEFDAHLVKPVELATLQALLAN
jgi:PAS domain S-box-containing protein